MNRKEARKVLEVAKMLRLGPGNGWKETLEGKDYGMRRTLEEREQSLRIWLDTWILSALDSVGSRYVVGRQKASGK